MATYVNDLRLKEIATGDESGTWGASTNTNLELIAEAFSFGTEAITTNADTHTTTIADGSTDPGRSLFLKYTGTLDSACTITIGPNTVSKLWLIENATSGSQNIIIKQGSGATVTVPNGQTKAIYSDGAGSGGAMVDAFAHLNVVDLTVEDDLTITDDLTVNGDIDLEGSIDVNGTTNLDVVDIDGALTQDGGAVFNEASADVDFRIESNGQENMFFVDGGDDAVVIGNNSSRKTLFNTTATAAFQIEGTSGNTAAMSIARNSNDDNGPQFVLAKSNGTSAGAVTVVTDDALLGRISFQGADGTQTVEGARVEAFVDGTPGADDMPGRLVFSTTADGASSPTERLRITSGGSVGISNTSPSSYYANELVVGASDEGGITIASGATTHRGILAFADATSGDGRYAGYIAYDHNTDAMSFLGKGNGSTIMTLDSGGSVGIGTSSITSGFKLEVTGDARFGDAVGDDAVEIGWSSGGSQGFIQAYDRGASAFRDLSINNAVTVTSGGSVGIGTSSPGRLLTLFNNDQPVFQITNTTSGTASTRGLIQYIASGTTTAVIDNQGSGSGGDIAFMQAGAEAMRIKSGSVLVSDGSTAAPSVAFSADTNTGFYRVGSDKIGFVTAGSLRAMLDNSGNVGIGATPESWNSNNTALQIGAAGCLFASTNTSFNALSANAYFDSTNSRYEYINADFATLYQQLDGTHTWSTAASGSADGEISFSESMRIDSSGRLSVGHSSTGGAKFAISDSGNATIQFFPEISTDTNLTQHYDLTASAYMTSDNRAAAHLFKIGTSEAMRIRSDGNVGIGSSGMPAYSGNVQLSLGSMAHFMADTGSYANGSLHISQNAHFDADGSWETMETDEASNYYQNAGTHNFRVAPSTSAGTDITWNTALLIDNTGNLLVGTTDTTLFNNTSGGGIGLMAANRLDVARSGDVVATFNRTTNDGAIVQFYDRGTLSGQIGVESAAVFLGNPLNGGGLRIGGDITAPSNSIGTASNNTQDLGTSSFRWKTIYAVNALNTSDEKLKQDIEGLSDAEKRVAVALKGLVKKYRFKDEVAAQGSDAKIRVGLIAQQVVSAFDDEGLTATDYALLSHETDTDAQFNELETKTYSINYSELLAFIISAI